MPARIAIIPVTPFGQNCMLLWDDATMRAAVIDPGGDLPRIEEAIAKTGVSVEAIWLTHGHIDHAGGAAELKERLNVPVTGPHEADRFLLDHLPQTGAAYGIPARPVTPDRWLAEGDALNLGDLAFSVLHCPGHSPGSVVFVNEAQRFAIVGDVLFQGSIGRTDLPGGDLQTLMKSIREEILTLPDSTTLFNGHGPATTVGHERVSNPFITGVYGGSSFA